MLEHNNTAELLHDHQLLLSYKNLQTVENKGCLRLELLPTSSSMSLLLLGAWQPSQRSMRYRMLCLHHSG
jgi:hypothetical protein